MRKFIQHRLHQALQETRVLNYLKDTQPLKDTDKIRVYHGFSSHSTKQALATILHGISGQERAPRIYSYEHTNNPYGLFVSISIEVVKRDFAGSGIIIEFDTYVKNLEAPVWKGQDSYFVQGQYTQGFKDPEEREQEIQRKRQKYKEQDPENYRIQGRIPLSDRPELAQSLWNSSEQQALFIGNLNPNEIKHIWYNETLHKHNRINGSWKRYTRKEFILQHPDLFKEPPPEKYQFKIFLPNEDFSMQKLQQKAKEYQWEFDTLLDLLKTDPYYQNIYLYPKQIKQLSELYT